MESNELQKFYQGIKQDICSEQLSEENGGTLEQLFTQIAINLLAESGETENARVAYHDNIVPRNRHKINAYAISDNYETLDLFITVFKYSNDISKISKTEVDDAAKLVINFFSKAKYREFAGELEESSEIFDFAHTLSDSPELKENLVRINAIIFTDGVYTGNLPAGKTIYDFPVFFKVIDLSYLYNISEKSHIPIEIDFKSDGYRIPCIVSPSENDDYQSYVAIIPGEALVSIYERFGARLLEQNVRSFLQFTGKINKGIRNTILKEPHMFLAFNNGIAATADSLEMETTKEGVIISKVSDLQIVNGGQTTASVYHTWKKDKADISRIFVQLKLSVVKNRENFSQVVSLISEYANTQNKVSVSDLSSNRPYHIELEKLSRNVWAPPSEGQSMQTRWFYERARGQYKNARYKEGFTKAKQKAFDLKNPKQQLFNKEELAKYLNSYKEIYDGRKLVVGPHMVVRGNQKNYVQFINYNLINKADNVYFEDVIAKTILFRSIEKTYGIKPNAIGDMRYITVPYSIAWFSYTVEGKLDLYKIWKSQAISQELKEFFYSLMTQVETFIKENAPGALYGEWAKKEDCWEEVKKQKFEVYFSFLKQDMEDPRNPPVRRKITDEETEQRQLNAELEKINSIPYSIWFQIEEWGKATELLSVNQLNAAWNIATKVRTNNKLSDYERNAGLRIIDAVIENAPQILFEIEENNVNESSDSLTPIEEITIDLIKEMVNWDRKYKKLQPHHFTYMWNIVNGKTPLHAEALRYAQLNLNFLRKKGFNN